MSTVNNTWSVLLRLVFSHMGEVTSHFGCKCSTAYRTIFAIDHWQKMPKKSVLHYGEGYVAPNDQVCQDLICNGFLLWVGSIVLSSLCTGKSSNQRLLWILWNAFGRHVFFKSVWDKHIHININTSASHANTLGQKTFRSRVRSRFFYIWYMVADWHPAPMGKTLSFMMLMLMIMCFPHVWFVDLYANVDVPFPGRDWLLHRRAEDPGG